MSGVSEASSAKESVSVPWPLRYLLIASLSLLLLAVGAELARFQGNPTDGVMGRLGPQDGAILPGLRIDFVSLGVPIKQVEHKLGSGKIKPTSQATLYHFGQIDLTCGVQEEKITSVLTRNPIFRTRTGVHVGSPVDEVVREYGDRYEYDKLEDGYTLHYWRQGIHFTVRSERVHSILITPALNQDPAH